MPKLTVEEILHIHDIVVKRFGITSGVINKGLLEAIVERPETTLAGEKPFDNVYSKAACLLESIIRWHPFADGNKRTALLTVIYYLQQEGYGIALPLSAIRLTVQIAKDKKNDSKSTRNLIKRISLWLVNHADKDPIKLSGKLTLYIRIPYGFLSILGRIGLNKLVQMIVSKWMAFDIYPEYAKEADEIIQFIDDALESSLRPFSEV